MGNYTNNTGVSLPLAVWLATDNYGGKSKTNPYMISATSLLKSPRQIVLGMRADPTQESTDVTGVVKSRIGTAIHSAVENAWVSNNLPNVLMSIDYPEELARRVVVNPDSLAIYPNNIIPVYVEQRSYKSLGKWTITGEYDFVFNGHLHDLKSTGTYTYVNKTKSDDYIKQGSIYRWLTPNIITDNIMSIDFIFTDFAQRYVGTNNYPVAQIVKEDYPLMSIPDTEAWIESRLNLIESHELTDESDLPLCTDKELWRGESVWKYYKSGQVQTRSTKNYDNAAEAYDHKLRDGNKGLVLEIGGTPTACLYCNVFNSCSQKDIYISSGELVI